MEVKQNFTVNISAEVDDKLTWFVNNYAKEISAWLCGEFTDDGVIIDDILIPKQDVSHTSVDTDGKALIKLRKEYGDKCLRIIGHWHSHNTMSAHWSGTDEDFIEEFTTPRGRSIFIVSSKSDGHLVRLELTSPFAMSLDELEYEVERETSPLDDELEKVIKDKVIETKEVTTYGYKGYGKYEQSEEGDYEKVIKDSQKAALKKMLDYNKKTHDVTVDDLSLFESNMMIEEFNAREPKAFGSGKRYEVVFSTKGKKEAIQLLKDLSVYLKKEVLAWMNYDNEIVESNV